MSQCHLGTARCSCTTDNAQCLYSAHVSSPDASPSIDHPPSSHLTMPAVSSGKVLVTGANGFIAVWVLQELLEHGFAVRGTVRSEDKATYLRDRFATYSDKFDVIVVNNMTRGTYRQGTCKSAQRNAALRCVALASRIPTHAHERHVAQAPVGETPRGSITERLTEVSVRPAPVRGATDINGDR